MSAKPTILCRCEDVTDYDVQLAVKRGAASARDLKLRTRIGMGACQGRICHGLIPSVFGGRAYERLSSRPPVRLVPLETLLGGDDA